MRRMHKRERTTRSVSVHLQLPSLFYQSQPRKVLKAVNKFTVFFPSLFSHPFINRVSFSAPSAVPPSVPVPASECAAPVDKPAKSKAELKAERRAQQEAERAFKQGKKGEVGQQAATSKPKVQPSELQPGISPRVCKK